MDAIEIIGLFAGACTTFSILPQLKKIIATKSAKDLSYTMYLMNCFGFMLWITYAFFKGSVSLILANCITLIFSISVIILKYHWDKGASN